MHSSEVHVSAPLTQVAFAYTNAAFVADELAPIAFVDKKIGKWWFYDREDSAEIQDDLIAEEGEANEARLTLSTTEYEVADRALRRAVDNDLIANSDPPIKPLMDYTEKLRRSQMLRREDAIITLYETAGSYASGHTHAAAAVWSNTSSDPLLDVHKAKEKIPPGQAGNTILQLVCGLEAWHALSKHAALRGGGAESSVLSREEAASRLGVDRIVVPEAEARSSVKGLTKTYAKLWDKTKATVCRVPAMPLQERQSGFTMTFRFRNGNGGFQVRTWPAPQKGPNGSQYVQIGFSEVVKVVQNDQGYQITAVMS